MLRSHLRPPPKANASDLPSEFFTDSYAGKDAPTSMRSKRARSSQATEGAAVAAVRDTVSPNAASGAVLSSSDTATGKDVDETQLYATALHKPMSILFRDATELSFEPKVLVPFEHRRGLPDRRLEVERRRRLYDSHNVPDLLRLAGLEPEELVKCDVDHLPLEIFDDTGYDSRDPEEWMRIAREATRPESRFLPARAFKRHDSASPEEAQVLSPCRIVDWDATTNILTVLWGPVASPSDANPARVPRIFVNIFAEDPLAFVQRLVSAEQQRSAVTSWIKLRLCCDAMPTDGLPGVEYSIAHRLQRLTSGIPLLSKENFPDVDVRIGSLMEELNLEWRRTHNRLLFEHQLHGDNFLQRLVQNATRLSLSKIIAGPNATGPGTTADTSATRDEGGGRIRGLRGDVFAGYDYVDRNRRFMFSTYYTQGEVVQALAAVKGECINALEKSLFHLPKERQMCLADFQRLQMEARESLSTYLRTTWRDAIVGHIDHFLANVGKGCLNTKETDFEIYANSKLQRFFTTVRFMLEDTLDTLVLNSAVAFTEFFEEVSAFDVKVVDISTVHNAWPGSDAADAVEKQPLFTIDLIVRDGAFAYSTDPPKLEDAVVDLLDLAIKSISAVPQVEKYIMCQFFWQKEEDGPFLNTVRSFDKRVCVLRERVRAAVHHSVQPLAEYVRAYDDQLEIVRLDEEKYIADYSEEERTPDEMREEIKRHLRNKKAVQQKMPLYISVGNFVVDCQSFCHTLADKNQKLAKLVMDLINRIAKKKTSAIREQFTKICKTLDKSPTNAEKLHDLKTFIANLPEEVFKLTQAIDDMRVYYSILESLQYPSTDDDFKHKWDAIGWPRQLDMRLEQNLKALETTEEELHSRMSKDMEEFQKRVDVLQRTIATFSKHTNSAEAPTIAAEVKVLNIEIKKCIEEARNFNNDQRLFGDQVTDYHAVFELEKEFKPYSDLWLTTYTWQDCLHKWYTDPFEAIDADELDLTVTQAQKTMFQLSKTFREKTTILKIVEEIRAGVDHFKPLVPIILALRNPGMKTRHWEGLSAELGKQLVPGDTIQTVKDCEELLPDKTKIVSYCEVASKEYGIEKALADMKKAWETRLIHIEPYKESGTYVLKDVTEIIELLDEHLNITQQLQFSHFKAFFAEEIDAWERDLNLVSDILEQWTDCQRSWRYLQPIFDSEDIALQLPRLHKLFTKVDTRWRKMLANAHQNPNCMQFCTTGFKALDTFKECNRLLEEVQRGLNDYLQDKRQVFPRFYFLSDEELLGILSQSKDVRKIDNDIKKLFEFVDKLNWADEEEGGKKNTVIGFISAEEELVPAAQPYTPVGNVESWLKDLENLMKASVHEQMKQTVQAHEGAVRAEWVLMWPGQCVIAASQIFWTKGAEDELQADGTVRKFARQLEAQLMELVDVVQSPVTALQRINMGALITIEVHAKDTIDAMVVEGVGEASSFSWLKQLRFYFEEDMMCHLRQVDAHFVYGGEYLGNTARLVVTPLTDRIYLTLTGALALCLGGAPAGPAGTGKTETTKDLAKALAKQCVVFNCQEGMTYLSMGKFFKGLAWSGAWACFDEFNRIDVEVLSVVAQQVTDLQQACITKQFSIVFEESDVTVDPTYAIFITMNPGYAGRTELPDNLKVLFRPVACMVPDYAMIGEIRLFSYGYRNARALAQKMVMTFKLSSEQLSSQDHYDFGMRAVNTVISAAGINKREYPNQDENVLLLRALRDSNVPKFLKEDLLLFDGIISDLFPNVELPESDAAAVQGALEKVIESANLQKVPTFIAKCLQLYDITTLRHGLMLVGPTGAGKTKAQDSLRDALSALARRQGKGEDVGTRTFKHVYTHVCNPKAVKMDELYGAYDENGEWKDGVLCVLFRNAATYGEEGNQIGMHWVVFDGPVDALWIESMNTVLDDNKKLCLVSNEIIQMTRDMTMLFEVEDLAVASPATVSRCGMIYMDPQTCAPTDARIESWIATIPHHYESQKNIARQFALDYLDVMVGVVRRELKEYVPTVDNNLVSSFFAIMDGFIEMFSLPNPPGHPPGTVIPERLAVIEATAVPLLLMSLIWSVGASCDERSRAVFSHKLRLEMAKHNHEGLIPTDPSESVYEYCFSFSPNPEDEKEAAWLPWAATETAFSLKKRSRYSDMFIPTTDTIREKYLLKHLLTHNRHVAAVGPTGTGKSILLTELVMAGLPERFLAVTFSFSAQTSAGLVHRLLMSKLEKRRTNVYGAPAGKQLVLFIDDTNLPQKEVYGAQPPIELLRQVIGQGGCYNLIGSIRFNSIINMSLTLAMGPPGGGRNSITNRFMRLFNYVSFPAMSNESIKTILNTILCDGFRLAKAADNIISILPKLVDATIAVFHSVCETFLPTPAHVHYSFNLRDIMRVFDAVYNAIDVTDPALMLRLWLHENVRVFGDRLIDEKDRGRLHTLLDTQMQSTLNCPGGFAAVVTAPRLIFGDFCNDKRVYMEITDMDTLSKRMNEALETYNQENQPQMDLVMFLDAIEHVARISRVLRMPNGHCMLLGMGGSGRKSMTRLAVSICDNVELFTVEVSKSYGVKDWHESLSGLLLSCGKELKKITFLFSDTQIVNPTFLEDVASLLTSGDVPNIFDDKQIDIIYDMYKGVCMSEGLPTSKIGMYSRFVSEIRSNLHIVLTFSPIGDVFRGRMRMFPALINCCTIDWFADWPTDALVSVAHKQLTEAQVAFASDEEANNIAGAFEFLHESATRVTEQFFEETKRRSYCTPTSYLSVLSIFIKLFKRKREFVAAQKLRLSNGLEKLRETELVVAELEEKLRAQQPILKQTQQDIEKLMEQLKVDRAEAAEQEAAARVEENEVTKKAEAATKLKRQCAERLAAAEPALVEAVKVVREVKPAALSELANYTTVGDVVRKNLEALAIMLNFGVAGKEFLAGAAGAKKTIDWFAVARSKLKNVSELLRTLTSSEAGVGFDKEAMDDTLIEKIRPYYESEDCTPVRAKTASQAVEALCKWFRAMYDWYFINKEVIPLREQLNIAETELRVVNENLAQTRAKLKAVVDKVKELQQQFDDAIKKQKELEDEIDATTKKLSRAARLIDGLAGEKQRWIETVSLYEKNEINILGDMAIAAGATAYFGPLTAQYRRKLTSEWRSNMTSRGIACSEQVDLANTVGDRVLIQEWQVCGLPSDSLSTENAIIMDNANSWPLLIDPQGQANAWIRQMHKDDNLQVCKPSSAKFIKVIEGAIRLGLPCLLENVGESLDPALDPVLLKHTYYIGSSLHIRIGESVIMYDDKFKLYMTTKLPNPRYSPEAITTVSLLNFFITQTGLEDQLLGKTVERERRDLEEQKTELIRNNAEKNRELKALQDNILKLLQEAEGDILEKEELIDTLEMSKKKSAEIKEDLEKAKEMEQVIDQTRELYRRHAFRGSLLFFCVSALATVDPMYQFSLQWFINLFCNCIDNAGAPTDAEKAAKPDAKGAAARKSITVAPPPTAVEEEEEPVDEATLVQRRIDLITDYTTYNFYVNVCRSLFERHKLLFSFYLCTCIITAEGKVDEAEMRFFLTGATSTAKEKNPATDWISEQSWNDIVFISAHLKNFKGFSTHVQQNIDAYKALFDSTEPHRYPLPAPWDGEGCTPLQRLVITRCFRLDKVTRAIQDYVSEYLGERYIIVPHFNLLDAYRDSDCCSPLVFIISAGSDPMNDLLKFADTMRMGKRLEKVSLGQGQGKKAELLISNGVEKGQWVLLQNCHLATSWMPTLEAIVENFNPETIKKEFRLWLTSMPSGSFPVAVLQIAVKMTNEPPLGLRANMTRSYYGLKDEDLVHPQRPREFCFMLFSQCLFHAAIQERRRFGSLGFNIAYEFNDSDRNVCILQLRKFLTMYDHVPFDVLTFLTGEINYGGRVTDDWDRRCVMTMICDFICQKALQPKYQFSPLEEYQQVEPGNRNYYLDCLSAWPINADPAIFGLHENANITSDRNETGTILGIVLSLGSAVGTGGGGAAAKDAALTATATDLLQKLPKEFPLFEFRAKYPTRHDESMNTVLVQEAVRYNRLLGAMGTSLHEFIRAVKGEVVMSTALETMGASMFVNAVPTAWASLAYPSLMPLSSWMEDLVRRVKFVQTWYKHGTPAAFWIGGFFFPQAFLTGTLQNYARKVKAAIDSIKFGFKVLPHAPPESLKEPPEHGAIIYGLFIEGARWDEGEHTLAESRPKELYTEMPPLFLDPIINKPPAAGIYLCPVYKTLTRAGTLSTTGHSTNFVLPIELPTSVGGEHWVKRGTACLVSLDF